MTIYDAAPMILAVLLSATGYAVCRIGHDRMMARLKARKNAKAVMIAAE